MLAKVPCTNCRSVKTHKKGQETMLGGKRKQRYKCNACGKTFYAPEKRVTRAKTETAKE